MFAFAKLSLLTRPHSKRLKSKMKDDYIFLDAPKCCQSKYNRYILRSTKMEKYP